MIVNRTEIEYDIIKGRSYETRSRMLKKIYSTPSLFLVDLFKALSYNIVIIIRRCMNAGR